MTQVIIFSGFIFGTCVAQKKIAAINNIKFIYNGLTIIAVSSIFSLLIAILFPNFLMCFIPSVTAYALGAALMFGALNRLAIESCIEPMGVRMSIFSTITGIFCVLGSVLASTYI